MERTTLKNEVVTPLLEPYVLLRLDAASTPTAGGFTIGAFRGVLVFDPFGAPRFRLDGYKTPDVFVYQLHRIERVRRLVVDAGDKIARGEAYDGHMRMGEAYEVLHEGALARDAFEKAEAVARRAADEKRVQLARIRTAASWRYEDPKKGLKLMKAIPESDIDEVEMARQVGLAVLLAPSQPNAAKRAYRRALQHCPPEMKEECEEQLREWSAAESRTQRDMPRPDLHDPQQPIKP